jgi:hypothetical protein
VHGLALHRKGVVAALAGLLVQQVHRLERDRQEARLHRREDVGQVFEAPLGGPLAGNLEVEHVAVGDVGRRARIERGDRLGHRLLRRIARQLDLDAGLLLELGDHVVERLVLLRVEPLRPVDDQGFLRRRTKGKRNRESPERGGGEKLPQHGTASSG